MKTSWDPAAKESLRQIARYINKQFGREARKDFIKKVHETEKHIERNPAIGFIDPLFANRHFDYRSIIINGLSKMVYYTRNNTIHIAAFWDTRKDPQKQAEQIIEP